jgi:alpha-D-ribose 1-methylphosphonate 5-triphosphate synthase subunit PhnH
MSLDLPGFADPVLGAQSAFRAILEAMSRPGTVQRVGADLTPPAPLCPSAAAVLLTLVDADTTLHLGQGLDGAADWIGFHCGAPLTTSIAAASFALALEMPPLGSLATGTDDAPQVSGTLILQVASVNRGTGYQIAGPGLKAPAILRVSGLPDDFVAQWAANHALAPRGVDIILCAAAELVALPRSLAITGGLR